jgi:hypothetical protein
MVRLGEWAELCGLEDLRVSQHSARAGGACLGTYIKSYTLTAFTQGLGSRVWSSDSHWTALHVVLVVTEAHVTLAGGAYAGVMLLLLLAILLASIDKQSAAAACAILACLVIAALVVYKVALPSLTIKLGGIS